MVFLSQAYQFLTRLYKEYSLAGGGPNSPAQEPTKACSSALCCMVVVVPRVQLKHRVDPLGLIECLNLFCVLPDIPQDLVSRFALLVTQGKVHTIWPPLRFMGEDILFHTGKPEGTGHAAHPGKEICLADGIQRKQTCQRIPGDPPPPGGLGSSLSVAGMISSVRSRRYSSAPPVQGSAFLKAGGLSQGTISWFHSRSLMATSVNGGQPAACADSYTFCPSSRKVLR